MKKGDNRQLIEVKKGLPKLTRKQAAFVKEIQAHPKQSATQAASKVYAVSNQNTARSIATENLSKPAIISHLDSYNDIVESKIKNTIIEFGDSTDIKERALAIDTAKWVHDKVHGKATQRTENTSISVNIEAMLNELL